MKTIAISRSLEEPVTKYQEKRKFDRFTQAANELIRIGLETEAQK